LLIEALIKIRGLGGARQTGLKHLDMGLLHHSLDLKRWRFYCQ
jgi:hypothetical protein